MYNTSQVELSPFICITWEGKPNTADGRNEDSTFLFYASENSNTSNIGNLFGKGNPFSDWGIGLTEKTHLLV